MFQIDPGLAEVPIVAVGTVIASTEQTTLNECLGRGQDKCRYAFTVKISKILKGKIINKTLDFELGYWRGCPGVDTYKIGEEMIWLIDSASTVSLSKLHGVSCGRGAQPLSELSKVEAVLKKQLEQAHAM